jgi:autotransporter-associated beta strand protein
LNRLTIVPAVVAVTMLFASSASAQLYTTTASTTIWDSARWSASGTGPFNGGWVSGSAASFQSAGDYVFANLTSATVSSLTLGNITTVANANVAFSTSSGKTINFAGNTTTISTGSGSFVNLGGFNTGTGGAALSITKTGAGILALNGGTGASFTGGFTLNAGTVIATSTNSFGSGSLTIGSSGATIGSGKTTAGGVVTAKDFSSKLTGGINLNGDLQLGTTGTWANNSDAASMTFGALTLGGAGTRTITIGSSGTQTFNGIISGTNELKFASTGAGVTGLINLTGANTYSGGTLVSDALLQVSGNNGVLGTGTVSLAGDTASQLKISAGLTLANDFDIAASSSVKTISNFGADATISGNIVNNDADQGAFIVGAGSGRVLTIAGDISGAGGLQVGVVGDLDGVVVLGGNNTYAGTTVVDGGMLQLGSATAIPSAAADLEVTNNGTLDLNGFSATFEQITGASGSIVSSSGAATLTLGSNNTSSTLTASLGEGSSNLNLDKIGTGTLTLGSYFGSTGTATVSDGTLELTNQGFAGSIVVAVGATLKGSDGIDGDLTVNGKVDLRDASLPKSLSAANITLGGASSTDMTVSSSGLYSSLNSQGALAYNGTLEITYDALASTPVGTAFNLFSFSSVPTGNFAAITTTGSGEFSGVTFTYDATRQNWYSSNPTNPASDRYLLFTPSAGSLVIVPEPSTWAMTLASVGFAGWMARRKKIARKRRMA